MSCFNIWAIAMKRAMIGGTPQSKANKANEGRGRGHQAPPTDQRVSFQVHRVNAKLAQVANTLFRYHDLDLISSRILVFLLEREEMRVGELVDLMVLPQSTISHQLQRLDKRKLVRRRRAREDNRAVAVTLTPAGRQVAAECHELSLNVYRRMTEGLSDNEVRQLGKLLGKMFDTLEGFVPQPLAAGTR
jgi:DNA-binding MarR family transcriptional regulator